MRQAPERREHVDFADTLIDLLAGFQVDFKVL
jgi:hypothetical protein